MGKIVNNYELLEQLGQGGMGVVYKARHIHFDEIYAVKRLWEHFGANEMVLNLFLNEAKILRKLNHKNIVHVTDVFTLENQNYIVMEYIRGRSLDEIIKKEVGPIHRERAINLFKQMLEGIAYIHNQPTPIIHRDIKPLNLLITDDDTVKITDFGIAKALDAGQNASTVVKGTPVYMSPEQIINPKSVDIRTDVYSLGMTFYEMLCAKTPFTGANTTTPTAVYAAIMNGNVPPPTDFYPGISDALSDFVMKSINRERTHRFANANEMLWELERLERGGQTTVQDTPEFQSPKSIPVISTPTIAESHCSDIKSPRYNSNEMLLVEGGTFMMKSNADLYITTSVHQVTVSSFLIGKMQVTLDSFEDFIHSSNHVTNADKDGGSIIWKNIFAKPGINWRCDTRGNLRPASEKLHPVIHVSWYDAVAYCNWLSEKIGLKKAYIINMEQEDPTNKDKDDNTKWVVTCDFNSNGYRLPTEAEWEFAARGGNKSQGYEYSGSNAIDEVAWYRDNSDEETHDIGEKQANELGIYDMCGNVWEWCWDWASSLSSVSQANPTGSSAGSYRVIRGGCYDQQSEHCRVIFRYRLPPSYRIYDVGFRVVRTKN